MKNLREMTYEELNDHVKETIQEIRLRAYKQGYEQGRFDEYAERYEKSARKEMIKETIRDNYKALQRLSDNEKIKQK